MKNIDQEMQFVNQRFDRDAVAFNAIYDDDGNALLKWFNKSFRQPIFERFDIAFQEMGALNGKSVIDIGCGSGIYLTNLLKKNADHIVGIDFSSAMLALAAQKIKPLNTDGRCVLKQANFMHEDFTKPFNFSLAMGVFDYLQEPVSFLKKMRATTSERILASFPAPSIIRGTLRKLRYKLTARGTVYYYTKEDIERLVRAAGLSDYKLIPITSGAGFILSAKP